MNDNRWHEVVQAGIMMPGLSITISLRLYHDP
jgi:hypothetical protein